MFSGAPRQDEHKITLSLHLVFLYPSHFKRKLPPPWPPKTLFEMPLRGRLFMANCSHVMLGNGISVSLHLTATSRLLVLYLDWGRINARRRLDWVFGSVDASLLPPCLCHHRTVHILYFSYGRSPSLLIPSPDIILHDVTSAWSR